MIITLLGKKVGMSRIYTDEGCVIPVTLIEVYQSLISEIQVPEEKCYSQITLSYGTVSSKGLTKPEMGFYLKKGLTPYLHRRTFKTSRWDTRKVGDFVSVNSLEVGNLVTVTGVSKGKGFAGAVKKFGFAGQLAQHGTSLTHRSLGGLGCRRREGKVFKGKKMAGHMGQQQVTIKGLKVMAVDAENALVAVKGAVPGAKGTRLTVQKPQKIGG